MTNIILNADSYKLSHYAQLPDNTEYTYSYAAPRSGDSEVVVLGVREFTNFLNTKLTRDMIDEAKDYALAHGLPFNDQWYDILEEYKGSYPVKFISVPEGTIIKPKQVAAVICNTDPKYPWLPSFFETALLRCLWYPSTVASISRKCKGIIKEYMEKTGADMSTLDFKLHDFGSRGSTCEQASAIGGYAHLTQFKGTDNLLALPYVNQLFNEDKDYIAGFSIQATEHSTVTMWGEDNEHTMYYEYIKRNMKKGETIACVMDSYNFFKALNDTIPTIYELTKEREGTFVVRPDSGDPVLTPVRAVTELLRILAIKYKIDTRGTGGCLLEMTRDADKTTKGFLKLPPELRVIQGDGITPATLKRICHLMYDKGLSIDNIAFGMGAGLLQKVDRDTYGWSVKCSLAIIDGDIRHVSKNPVGSPNKKSLTGFVCPNGKLPETLELTVFDKESSFDYYQPEKEEIQFVVHYNTGELNHNILAETMEDIRLRSSI